MLGCVPILVTLLQHQQVTIQHQSLWALGNIAGTFPLMDLLFLRLRVLWCQCLAVASTSNGCGFFSSWSVLYHSAGFLLAVWSFLCLFIHDVCVLYVCLSIFLFVCLCVGVCVCVCVWRVGNSAAHRDQISQAGVLEYVSGRLQSLNTLSRVRGKTVCSRFCTKKKVSCSHALVITLVVCSHALDITLVV